MKVSFCPLLSGDMMAEGQQEAGSQEQLSSQNRLALVEVVVRRRGGKKC